MVSDSMSLFSALKSNNWKDTDPILAEVKEKLRRVGKTPTLLWVPSHCRIEGNDMADKLAGHGTKMDQKEIGVTSKIVKARIKREKWKINHERALQTYRDRRQPQVKIEGKWPRQVRRLYSRLRTGHSKELKHYSWRIEKSDDMECECGAERETIEHVVTECPLMAQKKRELGLQNVKTCILVDDPELGRKLLEERFPGLKIRDENAIDAGGGPSPHTQQC